MGKKDEIQKLIQDIEDRDDLEEKEDMKKVFEQRLKSLSQTNYQERGICIYYILRIILKTHQHYESREAQKYYKRMEYDLRKQHLRYKEKLKQAKHLHKATRTRIDHFYRLMERFYSSLEVLYDKKDFLSAARRAYEEKMYYRKHYFLFQKRRWRYFEYAFLDVTCKYGDSFFRWGLTSFLFGVLMAFIYYFIDIFSEPTLRIVPKMIWYDYFYFSVVILTSLGLGDIVPITFTGKLFTAVEAFFGFIMLGVFVNLIQKKL